MSQGQTIVVVDDSPMIHRLVQIRLKDLGLRVHAVENGEDGLAAIALQKPDLILLDVGLPDIDGFEVCARLKADQSTHDIPVIFLTGSDESLDKVRGFDLGAVDYVTKPFDPAELRARVISALRTKTLMDLLTTQAQMDGLTGLHNRRYFDFRVQQILREDQEQSQPTALMVMDVDKFKQINDQHGHPKGDQVIQRVAQILRENTRRNEVPCRFGGDEYAMIMPNTTRQAADICGSRLVDAIRGDFGLMSLIPSGVTASLGLAVSVEADTTPEQLLARADEALYETKQQGRNGYTLAA